jgi:hypothetical protein
VTGRAEKTPLVRSVRTATDEAAGIVAPFFVEPPETEKAPGAEAGATEEPVVWEGFSFSAQGKAQS